MLDAGVVYLDLETTGATAHFDRITEIGLVEIGADGSIDEWSTLVNPGMRIPLAIEPSAPISTRPISVIRSKWAVAPVVSRSK